MEKAHRDWHWTERKHLTSLGWNRDWLPGRMCQCSSTEQTARRIPFRWSSGSIRRPKSSTTATAESCNTSCASSWAAQISFVFVLVLVTHRLWARLTAEAAEGGISFIAYPASFAFSAVDFVFHPKASTAPSAAHDHFLPLPQGPDLVP